MKQFHSVLEGKGQAQNADRIHRLLGNVCIDANLNKKEFDKKMDAQYLSEGEPNGAIRLQNEATAEDEVSMREESNSQATGR